MVRKRLELRVPPWSRSLILLMRLNCLFQLAAGAQVQAASSGYVKF